MEVRLIIPAASGWTGRVEVFAGRTWRVSEPFTGHNLESLPKFHTISYTWGPERSPGIFDSPDEISSRTRPALEAAIRANEAVHAQAYWIDAICIPRSGPARVATLESMGLIYSRATSCIVLLEQETWFAVHRSRDANSMPRGEDLEAIDREPWMRSVWTYQEIVNALTINFTTFDMTSASSMPGNELFSITGKALQDVKRNSDIRGGWQLASTYPGISALEDTLADWQVGEYLGMSALTCLTGIAGRHCDPARPANRLYALLGVLTREPSWSNSREDDVVALTEEVMRICETKADFSYIYTSNAREAGQQRRTWRPVPDADKGLVPLLCWHSWGSGQPGSLTGRGLELHEMVPLDLTSQPSEEATQVARRWLHAFCGSELDSLRDVQEYLPKELAKLGLWTGAKCRMSEHGFVLLPDHLGDDEEVEAFASAALSWTFGSPGVAKVYRAGVYGRCVPLVHVGMHFQKLDARVSVQV